MSGGHEEHGHGGHSSWNKASILWDGLWSVGNPAGQITNVFESLFMSIFGSGGGGGGWHDHHGHH